MAGLPMIHNAQELEALVEEIGLLPFVSCGVEGFSLEECTPTSMWFVKGVEGPWEWRETLADSGRIAYAKLFRRKAGFVSRTWYPDLANWRRGGLDFDERYAGGMISRAEKQIMDLLRTQGPMLTRALKAAVGAKGFDTAATSLQMRTDITVQRLEYNRDAFGREYGFGVSRLAPSESVFGDALPCARFDDAPEASLRRLCDHVAALFPAAAEKDIHKLLR